MTIDYWNKKHKEDYSKADWAHKPGIFAKQAVKYFPKKGKLLEIGTGQGGDADYFQSLGYEVVATDYSDAALKSAKTRIKNVEFKNLDTSKGLPFDDESFDIVYSHMALHYFDSKTTKRVFADIHRVLKPNGIFVTITNTIEDPEIKEKDYKKIADGFYQDPKGITKRYFSFKSMSTFTKDLFETLLLDNKGQTYKDDVSTLIRFVGKKE